MALGNPTALFPMSPAQMLLGTYDVMPAGQKIVILSAAKQASAERVTLVVNWPALLKKP